MGINTINEPASHYGLSLILGGAEGSLWDITGVYASFSRILNNFYENDGLYNIYDVHSLHYQKNAYTAKERLSESNYLMDAGSVWLTYSALRKVNRPETEYGWENFSSSSKIAWKTGTSFGFRDAWAVGTDAQYVVGVWAGNADGEGRPGLVGVKSAAPLLFDIFKILPGKKWFDPPYDEMVQAEICPQSGYLPGPDCPEKEKIWMHKRGINFQACTHHQLLHLDEDMKFRLSAKCASVFEMQHVPWFVLPPAVGYYYKNIHPEYKPVPPFREGCGNTEDIPMEFIYPKKNARIYIPREHNNERGKVVFKLAHQEKEVKIFWYLDNTFLGSTASFHQMALRASEGEHELVVIDEKGNVLKNSFFILGKSKLK
jgi:penicillin-binding protein 1C